MPCHSPTKTRVTVSLTRALPSGSTVMLSSKLEMRQDFAKTGEARLRVAASSSPAPGRNHLRLVPIMGSELHGNRLAVGFGGLEELAGGEAEHAGKNVCGERLDLGVQIAHHGVVIATRVLDRVFGLA